MESEYGDYDCCRGGSLHGDISTQPWTSWASSRFVSEALALPACLAYGLKLLSLAYGLKLLSLKQLLALCMYDAARLLGCGWENSSLVFLRGGRMIRGQLITASPSLAESSKASPTLTPLCTCVLHL